MTIYERILADMKNAMKVHEKQRLGVLRMLKAKILEKEVELRGKHGLEYHLNDQEAIDVLSAYAKQRRQSIQSYREANREDLASREEAELTVVLEYLPRQLTEEAIERLVEEAVAESGATGITDLGLVMKVLMPKVKGAADGKLVNEIVRRKLGN